MIFTNISDVDMTIMSLARKGYGSVNEVGEWDTKQFLDAVEFESIISDIENQPN